MMMIIQRCCASLFIALSCFLALQFNDRDKFVIASATANASHGDDASKETDRSRSLSTSEAVLNGLGQATYPVDVSFPIKSDRVSTNYPWLPHNVDPERNPPPSVYENMPLQPLGDKQKLYHEFLQGCRDYNKENAQACDDWERERFAINSRQPPSMQNYTALGFKKIKAPEKLFQLLKDFWEQNRVNEVAESWSPADTATNHWAVPTSRVCLWETNFQGAASLREQIWGMTQMLLEEWTGQILAPVSLYGIRLYKEGSILAPHVDRLPLVSSVILNVAQDVDEPWPLEVYGHDGKVYNITMEPGDLVLYESHSLIHGRPFPLKGRFFANVFIHFEPVAPLLEHARKKVSGVGAAIGSNDVHNNLPSYIIPGSPAEEPWRLENPDGWKPTETPGYDLGFTLAHRAAEVGDLDILEQIAEASETTLRRKDKNGWQPIHMASRGGKKEVVEMLIKHGADLNERTDHGGGSTPLRIALDQHGTGHHFVQFLETFGALNIGPEL